MSQRLRTHLSDPRAAGSAGRLGARTPIGPGAEDLSRTLKRTFADRSIQISLDEGRMAVVGRHANAVISQWYLP